MRKAIRSLVFLLPGLIVFAIFASLYLIDRASYYDGLYAYGIEWYEYPFVDWEYFDRIADCSSRGVDVYTDRSCLLVYSPLWLHATFIPGGPVSRNIFGIGFILGFLASLPVLFRPRSGREAAIYILSYLSPAVGLALERGNIDVLIYFTFILVVMLGSDNVLKRIASYVLILFAGLLKFYPLVGLLIAVRERFRTFLAIGIVASGITLAFIFQYRTELVAIGKNIPFSSVMGATFGAVNVITGPPSRIDQIVHLLPNFGLHLDSNEIQALLIVLFFVAGIVRISPIVRNADIGAAFQRMGGRDRLALMLGSIVIAGCFFAGQSIEYRDIQLLLVIAGLVALRRETTTQTAIRKINTISIAFIFLMWEGIFRHAISMDFRTLHLLFWVFREIIWWDCAYFLVGLVIIFISNSLAFTELTRIVSRPRTS